MQTRIMDSWITRMRTSELECSNNGDGSRLNKAENQIRRIDCKNLFEQGQQRIQIGVDAHTYKDLKPWLSTNIYYTG